MVKIALETEGVAHVVSFAGLNPTQFTNTPNYAIAFLILKKFDERDVSAKQIADAIQAKINTIQEGMAFVIMPPPILGLGNGAGYSLFVEDRAGSGYGVLQQGVGALQGALMKEPGMGFPFSGYQSNVPQVDMDVDRVKAKTQGVALRRPVRDFTGLSRLDLRQRFQSFRPHLACVCAGRGRLPQKGRGHYQPKDAKRARRDGAGRLDGEHQAKLRP